MSDQPLQPFAPPTALTGALGSPTAGAIISWFLYLVLLFWIVYTLVAIYHWFKYSHAAKVAIPAIGIHLAVSFALISFALSGTVFL